MLLNYPKEISLSGTSRLSRQKISFLFPGNYSGRRQAEFFPKSLEEDGNIAIADAKTNFGNIIKPSVQEFPLEEANTALMEMKESKIRGAKVLRIG